MISRRAILGGVAAVGAAGTLAGPAFGQAKWPTRPITMICPWAAGGSTDATARIVAQVLERDLKQPVNVVNRTGGSGVVGHSAIATAQPDGYNLGVVTVEIAMMHHQGLTKLRSTDYIPLALMGQDPASVQVSSAGPYKDVAALAAAIKSSPRGKLKASGVGQGGIWHLALIGWLIAMGVNPDHITWVPSNGAAPAMQDLAAGGLDFVVCALAEARPMVEAGKAKSLAVMSDARNPQFADVPTLSEAIGVKFSFSGWRGIAAPKGLPAEIQTQLIASLTKVFESKEYNEFMTSRGLGMTFAGGADFAKFMEEADAAMGAAMKAGGLAKG